MDVNPNNQIMDLKTPPPPPPDHQQQQQQQQPTSKPDPEYLTIMPSGPPVIATDLHLIIHQKQSLYLNPRLGTTTAIPLVIFTKLLI